VAGVSFVLGIGVLFIAIIRHGTPTGRRFGDIIDIRRHWRLLVALSAIGVGIGVVGQLVV